MEWNGLILEYVAASFTKDKEIVHAAIQQNQNAAKYAHKSIKK